MFRNILLAIFIALIPIYVYAIGGGTPMGPPGIQGGGADVVITDTNGIVLTNGQMNSVLFMTGAGEVLLPDVCDSASGQWMKIITRDASEQVEIAVADTANDLIVLIDGTALDVDDEADLGTDASNWAYIVCLETNKWYITSQVGIVTDGGAAD